MTPIPTFHFGELPSSYYLCVELPWLCHRHPFLGAAAQLLPSVGAGYHDVGTTTRFR
jgi:hypothetical protein